MSGLNYKCTLWVTVAKNSTCLNCLHFGNFPYYEICLLKVETRKCTTPDLMELGTVKIQILTIRHTLVRPGFGNKQYDEIASCE